MSDVVGAAALQCIPTTVAVGFNFSESGRTITSADDEEMVGGVLVGGVINALLPFCTGMAF